jgi:hypothetical protein
MFGKLFVLWVIFQPGWGNITEETLEEQSQSSFCALWKNSSVDRHFKLSELCSRLAKKFGDKVCSFMAVYCGLEVRNCKKQTNGNILNHLLIGFILLSKVGHSAL